MDLDLVRIPQSEKAELSVRNAAARQSLLYHLEMFLACHALGFLGVVTQTEAPRSECICWPKVAGA